MSLRRTWLVLTSVLLASYALAASALDGLSRSSGTKADQPGRLYELHFDSAYAEGCVSGLCECAVTVEKGMKGTFSLRPDAGPRDFALDHVELRTESVFASKTFAGSGRYIIDERVHRMTLKLSTAGGEAVEYDSGWVERPRNTEGIVIDLPMAEATCWGNEFSIVARPYQLEGIKRVAGDRTADGPAASFGTVKARW
jgi:hypothetical protein